MGLHLPQTTTPLSAGPKQRGGHTCQQEPRVLGPPPISSVAGFYKSNRLLSKGREMSKKLKLPLTLFLETAV